MTAVNLVEILLNQCSALSYGNKKVLYMDASKITPKIKRIVEKDGCYVQIKNEDKMVLTKIPPTYPILDPDSEIISIVKSKKSLKYKLKEIEKIVKHYQIYPSTAKFLKKFLNLFKSNEKFRKIILKIEKEIKIINTAEV
jgi:hypothetical protein